MPQRADLVCDVCSGTVGVGFGYILSTTEIVGSAAYWEASLRRFEERGVKMSPPIIMKLAGEMAAKKSPWITCEECIGLFEVDRAAVRGAAEKYWAGGAEPEGGAADAKAAFRAAMQGYLELRKGVGFSLEAPHR